MAKTKKLRRTWSVFTLSGDTVYLRMDYPSDALLRVFQNAGLPAHRDNCDSRAWIYFDVSTPEKWEKVNLWISQHGYRYSRSASAQRAQNDYFLRNRT